jgi:cell division protein DivIC
MKKKADFKARLFEALKNRYLLTGLFGLFWVTFISDIDLVYLTKSQRQLNQMHADVAHYQEQISETHQQLEALTTNPKLLESFAREEYFMKRDNEDLFRIVRAK